MKAIRYPVILVLALSFLTLTSYSQRTRRPTPRATPRPTPVRSNPVIDAAKVKVSNQLHNVRVFVDKMGPIAVGIENADRDAAARRLSSELVAANEVNKKKVVASIRALREGLVALETDFRTKPQLTPYLPRIDGIALLCGESEDKAIGGKFVESKEPLREIALKLNETLVVLNGGVPPARAMSNTPTTSAAPTRTIVVSNPSGSSQPVPSVKREPVIGMTLDEVSQSTWGEPSSKRRSTSANGTTEVWVYNGKGSVYFFNGRVSQIVK